MKRRLLAYLFLSVFACSCINAELAPSGEELLPPELKFDNVKQGESNLDIKLTASISKPPKGGECGFYLSKNEQFSPSDRILADSIEENSTSFSVTKIFRDYGQTYYCKPFSSNGNNEITASAINFTVKQFSDCVSATSPVVVSASLGSATLSYSISTISDVSLSDCGICYSTSTQKLSVENDHISAGKVSGTYTTTINNLSPSTTYYVCSYAREGDYIVYSNVCSFTLIDKPSIRTSEVSLITSTSATSGGNNINDRSAKITDKGIVWDKTHNPTVELSSKKSAGSGSAAFSCKMETLLPNTVYYVRAYASNDAGTSYGDEIEFITLPINVTGISLNQNSISIAKNSTYTLFATISPADATNKNISWSTSNASIATVTDGVVKGVAVGTAYITAKTEDGGYIATCTVQVSQKPTEISVSPTSIGLIKGDEYTLSAVVLPSDAAQTVSWSSSNSSIVSVTSSGVIKALSGGSATITATTTNDLRSSCLVTVTVPVTGVNISKSSISIDKNSSYTLTAAVMPDDASDKGLSWSSDNIAVATVDNSGKVTGVSVGRAIITVKTNDGDKTASCLVDVSQKPTGISVKPTTLDLILGNTSALSVAVEPSDASQDVSWSSANSSIASVSNLGVITALSGGTTTITATTTNGLKSTCKVTVLVPVTGVTLNQSSISVAKNASYTLTASVLPENASDKGVTWSSLNEQIATVSSEGVVTGKAVGKTTITVMTKDGGKTATCEVEINEAFDLSSTGTANCYVVNKAGIYKFKATVKGGSSESVGTPSSAETLWESFGDDVKPSVGDILSYVQYQNGYLIFETPSILRNGNAVVAVTSKEGVILWSWHIWVCKDFEPNSYAHIYNHNAGIMMDRNIGATSATAGDVHSLGLLYQWGRKDPFLGSCSISSNVSQAHSTINWPSSVVSSYDTGTIDYSLKHPTTFICNNSLNHDWYYTGSTKTDVTRWQTPNKIKGIYDPCPPGWRVPDGYINSIWRNAFGTSSLSSTKIWDNSNKGMNFGSNNGHSTDFQLGVSSNIWYPASGCRSGETGELCGVGDYGYYYSGSHFGDNPGDCRGLSFRSNGNIGVLTWMEGAARSYPVRCVKEGSQLDSTSEEEWIK